MDNDEINKESGEGAPAKRKHCKMCGSDRLIPYSYRPEPPRRQDSKRCFNGLLKTEHRCIVTCSKQGLLCMNCRLLNDQT